MDFENPYSKYSYSTLTYPFKELIQDLYNVKQLQKIHIHLKDMLPKNELNFTNEASTLFHKKFYSKLNSDWEEFIKIYKKFIYEEVSKIVNKPFLYQYLPSYRVHLPNYQAIHKWHFDSDKDHKHPDGEINFCLAITKMENTTAIWAETSPGKKDFSPMEIDYGEYFNFNGNKCTHGNKINESDDVRISFDFRILPKSKYSLSQKTTSVTSKKKFIIGEYYKASENF